MRNLRRVVWCRGMFLTPQSLQTADNWIDESLQFRFAASNFANWGFTAVEIQQESLANGLFALSNSRGVLPDGTLFSIPDPDAAPPNRPIAAHFAPDQSVLDVFLALPERHEGGKNFTQSAEPQAGAPPESSATTRYIAANLQVVDENGYDEAKTVQVARKNLRILFGDENRDGFDTLRLARVVRDAAGVYKLEATFIAPTLDIASSDYLMNLLRGQIERLVSKADALNAGRSQAGAAQADFNSIQPATFWLLHTVNSAIPELQHIWEVRRGHPEALWTRLIALAGALSIFSLDPQAREVPRYDHDNLGPCFTALLDKINTLLNTAIPEKCHVIPLRKLKEKDNQWTGVITSDEYLRNTSFFFAIKSRIGVDELIGKVHQLVKICAPDDMGNVINLSLPGVTLHHEQNVPSAIKFRVNTQYFSLTQSGRLWDRIAQSRNISLYIPKDIAEAQPEMLVVLP